jgi:RNA polymerase sigma factor for flagellar operon FliA
MSGDERDAAIRSLFPLVRRIARRVHRVVPAIELDDLIGDGSLGAIRAVDSFDASRGTRLETYARRLILGSMLNGLRRTDPVSERVRRRIRVAETRRYALAQELGRLPSAHEMERDDPRLREARVAAYALTPLAIDAIPTDRDAVALLDWRGEPARLALASLERSRLAAALKRLSARQRQVVGLHYYADLSFHAIGRTLRISPQRASQLHAAALTRLRATVAP